MVKTIILRWHEQSLQAREAIELYGTLLFQFNSEQGQFM